jgi:hypothetical protein
LRRDRRRRFVQVRAYFLIALIILIACDRLDHLITDAHDDHVIRTPVRVLEVGQRNKVAVIFTSVSSGLGDAPHSDAPATR